MVTHHPVPGLADRSALTDVEGGWQRAGAGAWRTGVGRTQTHAAVDVHETSRRSALGVREGHGLEAEPEVTRKVVVPRRVVVADQVDIAAGGASEDKQRSHGILKQRPKRQVLA